jgi:hypothetical protein
MTQEKRQLQEQIATHIYRGPVSSTPHPAGERRLAGETGTREIRPAPGVRTRQRVVTKPDSVQPAAGERYVERRNRVYSARAKAQTYSDVMPRTLAQTGVPASGRQMGAVKRPLPRYHASPVPIRSGRRPRRRKGLLWKVLGFFGFLLMVILGVNFALTGTAFRIDQVSIAGTHNPILVQRIQHMGMQGQNIFLIDVTAFTARIDQSPMVASAVLEKQWPNQLQVIVSERTPVLLWQTKHGTYSVDKHGVVIAPASETTGADSLMTVIDMPNHGNGGKDVVEQNIHPGARLNEADIAFAMAVFECLPGVVGITDYTLLYADSTPGTLANGQGNPGGSYVVESKAGWLAYLGGPYDANPLDNRLIELQQILALAQRQQLNLATVDLRYGLRPVYTLKS